MKRLLNVSVIFGLVGAIIAIWGAIVSNDFMILVGYGTMVLCAVLALWLNYRLDKLD